MKIDIRGVSKSFGDFAALEDVSLEVPEGSLTALLGPSGSGKSTLLRIIAGLETADTGTIEIAGDDVTRKRPQDRAIGFVFQHYAAFAHMSVSENVAFGLRIRKRPRDQVRARVDELLALVGLTKWSEQRPHQLSGGQRQRMALARALAVEPRVLLLDEPFGALDAIVRAELRLWLRRLHDEQGVTTVLVTHDQEEAMEVSDRIAVMHQGTIQQVGAPREVYDTPANEFVMGFLGPVSKLGGKLVRPHDVTVSLSREPGTLEAMVSRVVHLGFEVRIELEMPEGGHARAQLTRSQTAELELNRGDIVYVRPPLTDAGTAVVDAPAGPPSAAGNGSAPELASDGRAPVSA
jgi:sulfate transport system ATP-binding protein